MEHAVIDWDQLDMIADGFTPDFLEIYHEYLAEIPGLLGNLREKIRSGDALQTSRIAHQIKGSSANFGFIGLSQPVAILEQEAKAGSLARAVEHLAAAELGFSRAVAEVKARKGV
ncbi:MAG TPA: Hpt domain-containing protein [Terrimicrobiaceae bacterium]|nr:Hpt domain-containing protein [Terrimicrobiaceae bacterium]